MFVTKREGLEKYEVKKVADSIFRAMQLSGEQDRQVADEIADLITISLEKQNVPELTGSIIREATERVLIEVGRSNIAKAYILQGERRKKVQEAVRIRKNLTDEPNYLAVLGEMANYKFFEINGVLKFNTRIGVLRNIEGSSLDLTNLFTRTDGFYGDPHYKQHVFNYARREAIDRSLTWDQLAQSTWIPKAFRTEIINLERAEEVARIIPLEFQVNTKIYTGFPEDIRKAVLEGSMYYRGAVKVVAERAKR